ncbi:MAG: hypothetical protein WCP50_08940 [Actinomycetota bacterium]
MMIWTGVVEVSFIDVIVVDVSLTALFEEEHAANNESPQTIISFKRMATY